MEQDRGTKLFELNRCCYARSGEEITIYLYGWPYLVVLDENYLTKRNGATKMLLKPVYQFGVGFSHIKYNKEFIKDLQDIQFNSIHYNDIDYIARQAVSSNTGPIEPKRKHHLN